MGAWEAGMIASDDRLNAGDGAGEKSRKVFAASGTLTSTSYLDIPGNAGAATSVSVTKYGATSGLWVAMKIQAFVDAGSTALRLGIRINGVDYDVALGYFTSATQYMTITGWASLTGIAAGTYTCQARWKRSTGSGTITVNNAISELDMTVREVGL